jgi:hypothetical protein
MVKAKLESQSDVKTDKECEEILKIASTGGSSTENPTQNKMAIKEEEPLGELFKGESDSAVSVMKDYQKDEDLSSKSDLSNKDIDRFDRIRIWQYIMSNYDRRYVEVIHTNEHGEIIKEVKEVSLIHDIIDIYCDAHFKHSIAKKRQGRTEFFTTIQAQIRQEIEKSNKTLTNLMK